ncbi:S-adenosyl-L-methionine-dependent methyltransferase [Tricladium varicosporioides]|nr:S-adenosyl-L-methionine-dependent methyltransferase [Hymenoscyphus varicosporioides]
MDRTLIFTTSLKRPFTAIIKTQDPANRHQRISDNQKMSAFDPRVSTSITCQNHRGNRLEVLADDKPTLVHRVSPSPPHNKLQEHGRRYQVYSDDGDDNAPYDESGQDKWIHLMMKAGCDMSELCRMDLMHYAILQAFDGKAFFAPVKNLKRIIDMGTGTGIWTLDVGDEYPEAQVTGVDIFPVQPRWEAPNVKFITHDIESPHPFPFPSNSQQAPTLIHSRLLSGLAIRSWFTYLSKCFKFLEPGGWIEGQEFTLKPHALPSHPFPQNSMILEWHRLFREGMKKGGCDVVIDAEEIKRSMEEVGFIGVRVERRRLGMGAWSETGKSHEVLSGTYAQQSFLSDLAGLSTPVFRHLLGWTQSELDIFLGGVKREWVDFMGSEAERKGREVRAWWPLFSVYGQKPDGMSAPEG